MNDLVVAGDLLAKTKIFGDITPADGFVIASICYQNDITYDEFAETYNVMHGRLSKKTDAMLTDLYVYGGSHRVIERSATVAKAEFEFGENKYLSVVDFDALKNEPLIYEGREKDIIAKIQNGQYAALVIKAKYQTERARMQMMWARCVSDGVRVVCPAACKGIYTPEETSDFTESETHGTITSAPASQSAASSTAIPLAVPSGAVSVEECPVGTLKGQRWDSLPLDTLRQALDVEHPLFTDEMKNYIRGIIATKEGEASNG